MPILRMMVPGLTSHQNTASLARVRGEQFSFIGNRAILSAGKKPFIPGRLLDKKRPGYGGKQVPRCAHNLHGIINPRLQFLNRLESGGSQRFEGANRANLSLYHLTYNA